jgi:hypothetical protein
VTMKNWLRDRPWIWLVLLMAFALGAAAALIVVAERGKPEVVRPKGEY